MPKINLRLTDEEHEALRSWALESHRSIQREAVFRLFSERSLSERDSGAEGMTTSQPEGVGRISEDARGPKAQPSRTRSESDLHFKPDFK